jgi:hypothetical protein
VVVPLKDGVVLFVLVPPGELSIVTDAIASPTGPAARTTRATTVARNRPLSTIITVPPP